MQQIVISEKDKEELNKVIPNLEKILESNDLNELQIAIMIAIDKTLDKNEEATAETIRLEKIYDRITYDTKIKILENKYN